jgi:AcrR family transcriptional regulator
LDAALRVFAELGYAGASVRVLAEAAGVNVATVHYHFGDKAGLYQTVVLRLHADLESALPQVGLALQRQGLEAVVLAALDFCAAHRDHVRLLQRHLLDQQELPPVVITAGAEPLLARAEGLLLAFHPGLRARSARFVLLAAIHLVVRFTLESPAQLATLMGVPEPELRAALTEELARLIRRLLLDSEGSAGSPPREEQAPNVD